MTQPGYYDYEPTVLLARPVAFAGHPGSACREVVYDLASLTGLSLHDLDRLIQHEAGQSLWSLARQRGLAALHTILDVQLARALAGRPPGLLVIGEGGLTDPERLAGVRAAAALVFFRLPATSCYWALRREMDTRGGLLGHPYLPDRLASTQDLRPFLEGLRPVVEAADRVLDLEERRVHETVLELQRALPQLGAPREGR